MYHQKLPKIFSKILHPQNKVQVGENKLFPPPIPLITPQIISKGNRDDHSGVFQVRCHPSSPSHQWLGQTDRSSGKWGVK